MFEVKAGGEWVHIQIMLWAPSLNIGRACVLVGQKSNQDEA